MGRRFPTWLWGTMRRRLVVWLGGILAFILILVFILAYLIDEPLRRRMERDINASLKGYTVRVGKLNFVTENIRNVKSEKGVYPSPVLLEGVVFDKGKAKIEGHLDVYDRRQDKEKSLFRKMYEGLVGGISGLLENRPREEVATTIPITGDVEAPQTGTWQMVLKLIQNAFFRAILPGFEKEISGGGGRPKPPPLTPETGQPPEKPAGQKPDVARSPDRGPG